MSSKEEENTLRERERERERVSKTTDHVWKLSLLEKEGKGGLKRKTCNFLNIPPSLLPVFSGSENYDFSVLVELIKTSFPLEQNYKKSKMHFKTK